MSDDSFNRLPQAKVRIPEEGLKSLLDGLTPGGFIVCYRNTVRLLDDGILVSLETNAGTYPNIRPYPIDIFIPVPADQIPKVQLDEEEAQPKGSEGNSNDTPRKTEGTTSGSEQSIGEPESGDIQMASDGDSRGTTGLSSGPREVHGDQEGTASPDSVQSSVREDVADTQPVITT